MKNPSTILPTKTVTPDLDVLFESIARADAGDAHALNDLRKALRDAPKAAETLSGLAYNAESAILANVPAGAAELFRAQARSLRKELAGEGAGSALERMLIRRISLDYLATLQAERARGLAPGEQRSLDLARFYDQQSDRAHRRFLASVESLARVRKLIIPIQINIADQQVNVAGNLLAGVEPRDR